jgi:hypothetical protein
LTKSRLAASALSAPGPMLAAVRAAAADVSRQRSILNGNSCPAMMPSCKRRADASATFADFSATSPFPGNHRAAEAGWSRAPALGLDAEERMEQGQKFKWFAMSEALDGKVRQQSGRVRLGRHAPLEFIFFGRIIFKITEACRYASIRGNPGRPGLLLPALRSPLFCDAFAAFREGEQCRKMCSLRKNHG